MSEENIPDRIKDKAREWIRIEADTMNEVHRLIDEGKITTDDWHRFLLEVVEESDLPEMSKRNVRLNINYTLVTGRDLVSDVVEE